MDIVMRSTLTRVQEEFPDNVVELRESSTSFLELWVDGKNTSSRIGSTAVQELQSVFSLDTGEEMFQILKSEVEAFIKK